MDNKSYLNLEIKEFKEDEKNYSFRGYASVFGNKDYGNDVILQGAFKNSLSSEHNVKILWQHDMAIPVGVPADIYEDDKGLFVSGIMPRDDIFVKERVMPQMKIGSLELSIGYKTLDQDVKDNVRYIKEAFVAEVSLVSIGMNNKSKIIDFKTFDVSKFNDLNARDMETMFKNGFVASNSVAKHLVSLIKAEVQREVDTPNERDVQIIQDMKNIRLRKIMDTMSKIKNKNK